MTDEQKKTEQGVMECKPHIMRGRKMKWLKQNSWAIWNGAGTTLCFGYGLTDWQWWLFVTCMVILVGMSRKNDDLA